MREPQQRVVRERLVQALDEVREGVLEMGSMVDKAISHSMQALVEHDLDLARAVIDHDKALNRKRFDIETEAVNILAMHQPMAGDLRFILATQTIAVELERMGDYARGIAEIVVRMGYQPPVKPLIDLPGMAEAAQAMLRDVLDAYARRDAAAARTVPARDDAVDALNDRIYNDLIEVMIRNPDTVTRATYLLWITHNLERMADRVTNIAERIVFMVTGELVEMDVSSY